MTADEQRPGIRAPEWAWYLVGALIYLSCGFTEMMGSDLWWHIASGREIVQQGTIWATDTWSYSAADRSWHNHEWLSDLIFYAWVSLFGVPSLVLWKWLLIVATFCLLQRLLRRTSGDPAAALLAASVAAVIAAPFLDIRPQLYSLFAVVLLLNMTLDRVPPLAALLVLFLIWVNLHGGFIFGLMLLAFVLFPWRDFSLAALWRAFFIGLACVAVCLINPDGYRVFAMPLEYALNADSPYRGLAEWRSPFEPGGIASPLYPYTLVTGAAVALTWLLPVVRRFVPFSAPVLGIALLTAAMSVTSRRFIILWALAFALLLAPFLAALLRQRVAKGLAVPLLVGLAAWGVWRLEPYSLQPRIAYHYLTAEYAYPHGLVDVALANDLQGNTFAYYNWGGYLHWRVDGALKVFIDGRANTLYDDQTYRDYVAVLGARPGWLERIENSGAQIFMWPRSRNGQRLINGLLGTGRWILIYEDVRGTLLVHRNLTLPPTLRLPKAGFHRHLADASTSMRRGDNARALEAAERAYGLRPWDVSACSWLKRSLQANGRAEEGKAVIADCRKWFPSRSLR